MNHIMLVNILGWELYPCCGKNPTTSVFKTTFDFNEMEK